MLGADSWGAFDAQRQLAYALIRGGEIEEGRLHFDASLEGLKLREDADPNDIEFWTNRAYLFDIHDGDWSAAREKLVRYVALVESLHDVDAPHWLRPVVALSHVCLRLDDFACARGALEKISDTLDGAPQHPWSLMARAIELAVLVREGGEVVDQAASDLELEVRKLAPLRADILELLEETRAHG